MSTFREISNKTLKLTALLPNQSDQICSDSIREWKIENRAILTYTLLPESQK